MSDIDDLRKIIEQKTRRLQKLKEQQATKGANTPPEISIEIEDLEVEILELQTELDQIGQSPKHENIEQGYNLLWQKQLSFRPTHIFATSTYLCVADQDSLHFFSPEDGEPLFSPVSTVEDLSLAEHGIVGGGTTSSNELLLSVVPARPLGKASLWLLTFSTQHTTKPTLAAQRVYEAATARLSLPVLVDEKVYLIQPGPKLVVLDAQDNFQLQNIIPLPANLKNLNRDCVSFTVVANSLYIALCDGEILRCSLETGQTISSLRPADKKRLSPLTSDGIYLFFADAVSRKNPKFATHLHAIDANSGRQLWKVALPADPVGQHRFVTGQPQIFQGMLYVGGCNHYLQAFDPDNGNEVWRHQMPKKIEIGPSTTGQAIVAVDRGMNLHFLRNLHRKMELLVSCHYDFETPPVVGEWNPLIVTIINAGEDIAQHVVLRLSGDFEGASEHHTQQLDTIPPGENRRRSVNLKPTASGSTVHLKVKIEYKDLDDIPYQKKWDLVVPVRRAYAASPFEKEMGFSADDKWQYNYSALRALLTTIPRSKLNHLSGEFFRPHVRSQQASIASSEIGAQLVAFVDQNKQIETLLEIICLRHPNRYRQYIDEIKKGVKP